MAHSQRTPPGGGPAVSLASMGAEEQRTLAYASAIGREFDFPLLVAAMNAHDEAIAEELERLTHAGILRELPGGDRFAFVQEEVRARIYQTLTASRLRVLHRKIAEAMERLYPVPPPEVVPELGRHYFLGKDPERSYRYNRRAAELARDAGEPEEAAHHLERARLDLRSLTGDRAAEEAQIAEELGNLYFGTGDVQAADRLYAEGLERGLPADRAQRARLLLARAEVARELLDLGKARTYAEEARSLFAEVGDPVGTAGVHRILGRLAFHAGDYRAALDEAIRALDLLRDSKDHRTLGRLCIDIGNAFSMLGPEVREEAADWYRRAIARLSEVGDWTEVGRAYLNLASLLGPTRPQDALEYLEKGREYAERAHEPRWVGWGLANAVEIRLQLGQVEEAERDNQQALRFLERAGDALGLQQVLTNSGQIAERRGQWEDAERWYSQGIARAEELGLVADAALGEFFLARVRYKTRNFAGAREAFDRAKAADFAKLNAPHYREFEELGLKLDAAGAGEPTGRAGPT